MGKLEKIVSITPIWYLVIFGNFFGNFFLKFSGQSRFSVSDKWPFCSFGNQITSAFKITGKKITNSKNFIPIKAQLLLDILEGESRKNGNRMPDNFSTPKTKIGPPPGERV